MKRSLLLFTALLTALLLASPVYAADIRLSSSCTLADAIIAANRDQPEGGCPAGRGADTIILTRDITLDGGLPKITSAIAIEGNGYAISGDNRWRIFYNDGGALTIKDLTMTKGRAEGDLIRNADGSLKATTAQPLGGAIVNWDGELSIINSNFSGNSAEYYGGAIYNQGELSISGSTFSGSTFSGNSYELDGGAIYNTGELSISDSSFNNNSAGRGGAIYNQGELSISDSAFSENSAEIVGGAICNNSDGELSISDSAFSGNSAFLGGGAIDNWGELSISDSAFSENSAGIVGGGAIRNERRLSIVDGGVIFNRGELSMVNSAFSGNSAESGGAIYNGGELSMVNSSFSGNSADLDGGAIDNWGELSMVNSTFSHNSAEEGGGAIYNGGELSMVNSIITGNGGDTCYSRVELKWNISNFIQGGSCSPALRGDPMLGALVVPEDGSPAYFPLLAGSRAIDAADDDYCPETDQIGTVRPQGAGCDIGAIEYVSP